MSKCKYCGNDSGWFSSSHKDCEDKFKFGIEKINTQTESITAKIYQKIFKKKETLIWVFNSCNYLEDKTKKQYVGKTNGVSVRISKGVYYRASGFKGQQVEYTERLKIDKGLVAITDKHIYFAGPLKSTRIPYSKIISFIPFSDGFGILSDSSTAKPQFFVTGDGWFSYNLVTNAAKMQDS